jgi:hypothetical protein
MNIIKLEKIFRERCKIIDYEDEIVIDDEPIVYYIKSIKHAIVVFSDGYIFNCNPNKYDLDNFELTEYGLTGDQVEPSIKIYKKYWEIYENNKENKDENNDEDYLKNSQNSVLWSVYYLWWYTYKSDREIYFKHKLIDLENWCKSMYHIYV